MQQTVGSTPRGSQVCELLAVYQKILDTISDLPLVPMVLWRHGGRLHYLPRPKWLLRYFVVRHIDRMLASLTRRYSARAALGRAAEGEQKDREAVREFQQSLPATRHNTYFVLLIVAIFVLYGPIINIAVRVAINASAATAITLTDATAADATVRSLQLRQEVLDTAEKVEAALTANLTSINQALNALLSGGPLHLGIVTLGVTLSLYLVLRPFVPAFRLKRMLFNLPPEPEGRYRSAVARWSDSQATGLYERERRVLEGLGSHPPREFPFDVAVVALVMLLPLALSGVWFRLAVTGRILGVRVGFFLWGACVLILVLVRLGWLYRTWQRRQSGQSGPYMPYEISIRDSRAVGEVQRPLGIRMLVLLSLFLIIVGADMGGSEAPTLDILKILDYLAFGLLVVAVLSLPISLPWWYRINRELRDLDDLYDKRKATGQPLWSLLMMTAGWLVLLPPFIAVFKTCRRIQFAQARVGQPETLRSAWLLTPGLLLNVVLFPYLQHELNKVWAVEGKLLDPWPADTSRKAKSSTGVTPWLKVPRANHKNGRG